MNRLKVGTKRCHSRDEYVKRYVFCAHSRSRHDALELYQAGQHELKPAVLKEQLMRCRSDQQEDQIARFSMEIELQNALVIDRGCGAQASRFERQGRYRSRSFNDLTREAVGRNAKETEPYVAERELGAE
ncbi:MAG: hypothetical protein ACI8TQ_000107 [Planctomycetota bacterium]|jgi:hypothetical protein